MKKMTVIITALLALAAPVASFAAMDHGSMEGMDMAEEAHQHGAAHENMDAQCAKECAMLLKNCALEVDSIQGEIKKLHVQIDEKGADTYTLGELKALNAKLKEANETLHALQKPGK